MFTLNNNLYERESSRAGHWRQKSSNNRQLLDINFTRELFSSDNRLIIGTGGGGVLPEFRIRITIDFGCWARIRIEEKMDPDPHESQNSGVLEAPNEAVEGCECSQWRRGCLK
jgi:hypothetical protein